MTPSWTLNFIKIPCVSYHFPSFSPPGHLCQEPLVTTAVVRAFSQGLHWPSALASLRNDGVDGVDGYTLSAAILGCGSTAEAWVVAAFKMVISFRAWCTIVQHV